MHAMTVHRGQGSQFARVTVVLPPAESPLLTRELLYTAVTRARTFVRVVGSEAAVRAAVGAAGEPGQRPAPPAAGADGPRRGRGSGQLAPADRARVAAVTECRHVHPGGPPPHHRRPAAASPGGPPPHPPGGPPPHPPGGPPPHAAPGTARPRHRAGGAGPAPGRRSGRGSAGRGSPCIRRRRTGPASPGCAPRVQRPPRTASSAVHSSRTTPAHGAPGAQGRRRYQV